MFRVINMTTESARDETTICKAHCYFNLRKGHFLLYSYIRTSQIMYVRPQCRPCTIYFVDPVKRDCYLGHRDADNEVTISLTGNVDVFESTGTSHASI